MLEVEAQCAQVGGSQKRSVSSSWRRMAECSREYRGPRLRRPASPGRMRLPSCTQQIPDTRGTCWADLVHVSGPGLVEEVVSEDVLLVPELGGDHGPDPRQAVRRPRPVVVQSLDTCHVTHVSRCTRGADLVHVARLVGEVAAEPVVYPRQRPGELPLRPRPQLGHQPVW